MSISYCSAVKMRRVTPAITAAAAVYVLAGKSWPEPIRSFSWLITGACGLAFYLALPVHSWLTGVKKWDEGSS